MKVRNISAPKANEASKTAPKLLKLQLTDGVNNYSAIEMEPTSLQIETKPGTKVCILFPTNPMSLTFSHRFPVLFPRAPLKRLACLVSDCTES
jgi:RecQ mediated genome instability protein